MQFREKRITLGEISIATPIFFPSISSIKTNLLPFEYLKVIIALQGICKQFLISAYDIFCCDSHQKSLFQDELNRASDAGQLILMDSGNYESYWLKKQSFWKQGDYHSALQIFPCHIAFGFDNQSPPKNYEEHLNLIVNQYKQDQTFGDSKIIIPIIHSTPELIPQICSDFAIQTGTKMLAVPERRLGNGIFDRIRTVKAIRDTLNKLPYYVGIHLLGTGNPISISLYASVGADSFDGLEWCQTVADFETSLLYHFSHADFLRGQSKWHDESLPFQARILAHNLAFYADWMSRLYNSIHENKVIEFCRANFPQRIFVQCAAALDWEKKW